MASASVAATSSGVKANATTNTINCTLPSGIAAGDVLMLFVCSNGTTASTPAGWALLTNFPVQQGASNYLYCFWKVATGSEGATVTVSQSINSSANWVSYRFTGAAASGHVGTVATGSSGAADPPLCSPGSTQDWLWVEVGGGTGNITALSTGYTGLVSSGYNSYSGTYLVTGSKSTTGTSSEDPGPFTGGNAAWGAATVAIKPPPLQALSGLGAIASAEAFGALTVTPGTVALSGLGAIASAEAFGALTVTVLAPPQALSTIGAIASSEAFGTPVVALPTLVGLGAIASAEAFGVIVVTPGAVAITGAGGIASAEAFGAPTVAIRVALTGLGAIASGEAFGAARILLSGSAPRGLSGGVEYVIELFDSGTTFGPNVKLAELWDARNLGWSRYDRLPGKAFATLSQTSKLFSFLVPLMTHVKVWRVTPAGVMQVYGGKFIDYDSTGDDVVVNCYDYLAELSVSRTGYRTMYPTAALGSGVVAPEWALAKGAVSSPLGWVATGTIEDPVGTDGVTVIKTNNQFGLMDQMRLQLFYDLSEMGRANTVNQVSFDIGFDGTFRFYKNRGVARDVGLVLNGTVSDYEYVPGWVKYRNDLATIAQNVDGTAAEVVRKDDTLAAILGRRQDVATIKTLLGIVGAATEADQQAAVMARQLKIAEQPPGALSLALIGGYVTPVDIDICDTAPVEIANGRENLHERWRCLGWRGTFDEAGERLNLIVGPILQ